MTDTKSPSIAYLENLKRLYESADKESPALKLYNSLLTKGRLWTEYDLKKGRELKSQHGFEYKKCYYNAQTLAISNGYRYIEGVATSVIPCEHGWVVHPKRPNVVLDPTWDHGDAVDYFGIEIPTSFVIHMQLELKVAGTILGYYLIALEEERCRHEKS